MESKKELDLFGEELEQENELFGDITMEDIVSPHKPMEIKKESLEDEIFGAIIDKVEKEDNVDPVDTMNTMDTMDIDQDVKEPAIIPVQPAIESEKEEEEDVHVTCPSYPHPLPEGARGIQVKLLSGIATDAKGYSGSIENEDEISSLAKVRWGYKEINNEMKMVSNAKLLEWEDGSLSITIGNELFDLTEAPDAQKMFMTSKTPDLYNFLYKVDSKYYMVASEFTSPLNKLLRKQRKKRAQNSVRAKEILVNEDPELAAKEAERIELEKEKLERKLEKKREKKGVYAEQYEVEDFQVDYSDEEEEQEYDEGDDFVVGDDEQVNDEFEKELEKDAEKVNEPQMDTNQGQPTQKSNIVFSSDEDN